MKEYQREFIEYAISQDVLKFGQFTLKSGRVSPFFFNLGGFSSGEALSKLGTYYSHALRDSEIEYDILFGPAYKGIPLVSTVAVAMYRDFNTNAKFCFNRKEKKDHGEGGDLVGKMQGRIVVIDDVITAGTAIRESVEIIKRNNCIFSGVIIALNRQEKGTGDVSAIRQVEMDYGVKVVSIVSLSDVLEYLIEIGGKDELITSIKKYMLQYGA